MLDTGRQAAPAAALNGVDVHSAAAAAPEPAGVLPNAAASAANGVDHQMLYHRGREVFESMQQKGEHIGLCLLHALDCQHYKGLGRPAVIRDHIRDRAVAVSFRPCSLPVRGSWVLSYCPNRLPASPGARAPPEQCPLQGCR